MHRRAVAKEREREREREGERGWESAALDNLVTLRGKVLTIT